MAGNSKPNNLKVRNEKAGLIRKKRPSSARKKGKAGKAEKAAKTKIIPSNTTDVVLSLIEEYQVPYEFGEEVLALADALPDEVNSKDRRDRRDLRDLFTVTIDGDDAKDLDDAVSLEVLENGNYELGVHIADVTHYVKESTPLDREALKRGTSVYLADRVLPMLPPKISNGICSLNEKTDRLALSCFMEIDAKGNTVHHEIMKSVICVNHRMTYEIVNELLTREDSPYKAEYRHCMELFYNLETLRGILWKKRMNRGAIDFDLAEAKVILDEKGKVTDIRLEERNLATGIIEEAMLVCNETVAKEYAGRQLPFVFRSHEEPEADKIRKLSEFILPFGFKLSNKTSSKSIQKMLTRLKDKPSAVIIERTVLQSMTKAVYTPKNLGHYGLAAPYYCHFTSPIRRYPDLQIHRIIKETLEYSLPTANRRAYLKKSMPGVCKQSSITERRAIDLERAVENVKKAEYMEDKVGEEFEAIISGVRSWGLYVELPNTVGGLVPVRSLGDDTYKLAMKENCLVGRRNNKKFRLGDKVRVRLVKSDIKSGNLDFILSD